MLTVLSAILYTAVVLIAILLIGLVLVQPAKGGGFGSAFGGVGESMFGAQAMSQLSKVTVWLLSFFFILTLLLAVITGHKGSVESKSSLLLSKESAAEKKVEAKAVPAKAASVKKAVPAKAAPVKKAVPAKAAPVKKAVPAKAAAKKAEKKASPVKK